jgi:hypothetical protein
MKKIILSIGIFTFFVGCEDDLNWNLARSNQNDLKNVCFEYNCDSVGDIFYGNWVMNPTSKAFKGLAIKSSRELNEYIELSHTSTSSSSLYFWLDVGSFRGDLTDGTLVKVYINNVESPLHVERSERVERGYTPMVWWNIRSDIFPAGNWTVRIEIPGIVNYEERRDALKPAIDEIEIKCH